MLLFLVTAVQTQCPGKDSFVSAGRRQIRPLPHSTQQLCLVHSAQRMGEHSNAFRAVKMHRVSIHTR